MTVETSVDFTGSARMKTGAANIVATARRMVPGTIRMGKQRSIQELNHCHALNEFLMPPFSEKFNANTRDGRLRLLRPILEQCLSSPVTLTIKRVLREGRSSWRAR
ncbi:MULTISPECIES: hypothetical protein [Rhizobium]|uniref:hypothetical protein n=1 Tax=Rhizobium TaxID=379 RepID=UPI001404AA6B|nr:MULTISPECIES: hypothetical protein [Rhizobium]MBB3302044.1 hypothetical protein [Rhizobium sp. BK112]MBB3370965.1 hypothetical protein [Rhizobium sp. BK077]MBB4115925.1 hypothetical protein [Rhizobium sp. BK226]MBB4181733.1 hypothetical protein [Rhizobium sp. BK109]